MTDYFLSLFVASTKLSTFRPQCGYIKSKFFRSAFRKKLYETLESLQIDLDKWLQHYNYERPHRGYRNQGRRPFETIEIGKQIREQKMKEAA